MAQVKKKILVVDSSAGIGGGQRIAFDICSSLRGRFEFIVTSPKGVYNEKYSEIKVKTRILSGSFPIKQVSRIMIEEKPDIIHAHGTRAALWARAAVLLTRKKIALVYTLHGLHISKRAFPRREMLLLLERIMNRWTSVLVCVSDGDREEVLRHKLIDPAKIVVIKNGIDVDAFRAGARNAGIIIEELNIEGFTVLCSVGRLHPQKDFSTLLKALKIINEKEGRFVLLIAGDGPLRGSLESEAESLCVSSKVRFLGFREDVAGLMAASDIIVLSSNWEAFGLVCVEAGAVKKPVIASDIEGVREAVQSGITGYLFRKNDSIDLAEKIFLLASPEKRASLGLAGYEFVSKNYDIRRMAEEYRRLFDAQRPAPY
ncbi:MAG: glycosyltransferase family 4 protein [Candidatus Altiarchaeia archaeon]